METQHEKVI